jgi:preprotein translocase subunit SecD
MKQIIPFLILALFITACGYSGITTHFYLEPEEQLTEEQMTESIEILKERFNRAGASGKFVQEGNTVIFKTFKDVRYVISDLIKKGEVTGKIGDDIIFTNKDVTEIPYKYRRIMPCEREGEMYTCEYIFSFKITEEAGQQFAEATEDLDIYKEYLSESFIIKIDNEVISDLNIAADLKGQIVTNPSIQGKGEGSYTAEMAKTMATGEMSALTAILMTDPLPTGFKIAKAETFT